MYKYYWSGSEKLQSAWFRYELPYNILSAVFFESVLYLVLLRGTKIEVFRMNCTDSLNASDWYADDVQELTNGTNEDLKTTWLVTAGPEYNVLDTVTWSTYDCRQEGEKLVVDTPLDLSHRLLLGKPYNSHLDLSTQYIREPNTGKIQTQQGRLQLRRMKVLLGRTGACEVWCGKYKYMYKPRLGVQEVLGAPKLLETDSFYFPINQHSDRAEIRLQNNSTSPSAFLGAEWEGFYTTRVGG
jgi:hypothetical protein